MAERTGPPRWLLVALAAVAVAALAFAIGRFSTFGSAAEASAPATDSAEAGFAPGKQVHSPPALRMAVAPDPVSITNLPRPPLSSW